MPCQNCSCPSCLALAGSRILPTELPLPPPELMTTNRPPTGFEVGQSRSAIKSTEKRMSLLEAVMDDLAGEMVKTRRVVRMHRAAISPLRAFPPEILVAIFAEYVDMKDPLLGLPPPVSPPLSLMWICSRWRAIVLETPQFWTKISDSTPVLDLWINRSKGLPLDLHFDLSSGDTNPTLGALIPQAHRWEQAHFTLRSDSNSALSPVRGRLRSLKRLRISCLDTTSTLDFCKLAPQLTDIQLERVPNPLAIKLPWKQLQDCTLDGSMITLYTLQQAKNLQTCHLHMDGSRSPQDWLPAELVPRKVRHSKLKTLIVSYWHPKDFDINTFFFSLTLSSLQTLEFHFSEVITCPSRLAQALSRFFERSSLHLTTLKLTGISFSSSDLIDYLTLMPSLVSLNIRFSSYGSYSIDGNLLRHLSFSRANRLLPRLSSLTLQGRASFSKESLHNLIASRRDATLQDAGVTKLLVNLVLECAKPRSWRRQEPLPFHRFISEGLDLTYGPNWDIIDLSDGSSSSDSD